MALNSNKNLKIYYSISEVAAKFDVAESLLRFWETEFPQLKPHKAGRNIRQYSEENIEVIQTIYTLVKVRGLKLSAARQIMEKNPEGTRNITAAIDKLKSMREELVTIRKNLNVLSPE